MTAAAVDDQAMAVAKLRRLKVEAGRRNLADFCQLVLPIALSPWQADLCQRLEGYMRAVEQQKRPRLMVFLPPQTGKSTIVSRAFPAWLAGRHPEWDQILASYSAGLAKKHGRWIRNLIDDQREWREIFPRVRLSTNSWSVNDFSMVNNGMPAGQIISRGVGGGTTGNPAMSFVCDDPYADREDADSLVIRDKVDDWFSSVATSRLGPGAGILFMHTRWHVDDQAGRLLKRAETGGDRWEVLCHPAIGADGKALECRFNLEEFLSKKANSSPRDWSALYQQSPVEVGGNLISVDKIHDDQVPPRFSKVYQAWDFAITGKQLNRGDWSVGGTIAKDDLGRWWILDVCRGRWGPQELRQEIIRFYQKWKPGRIWCEGGAIWSAIEPDLRDLASQKGFWPPFVPVTPTRDKAARAHSLLSVVDQGRVYVPPGAPWWAELAGEMRDWRGLKGDTDDQVDALAWAFSQMETVLANEPPVVRQLLTPAQERSRQARTTYADLVRRQKDSEDKNSDW